MGESGKNIVILCDGTGNEINANLSNVLKLYRTLKKDEQQVVFYDPGVGTLSSDDPWSRLKSKTSQVMGLATGYGLDDNVLDAYRFLQSHYEEGDRIFLFGFSRGAYTARVLAGFLRLIGLLHKQQSNLCDYALTAYKRAAQKDDFEIAWRFERVTAARRVPIRFVGVWDTVSSVIVPRPDRLYLPSLQSLPYTATNSYVEVFRQAAAIDERRALFRLDRWTDPQEFKPNPFDDSTARPQDIKQVWFAGVHSDVGGGYPEEQSGLAKFPLKWMIDEGERYGLRINTQMYNHLVLGHERQGGSRTYIAPDAAAAAHNSLTVGWRPLEVYPKPAKRREWPGRRVFLGRYLPLGEPRRIEEGAHVHQSVVDRINCGGYAPPNLPPLDKMTIEP